MKILISGSTGLVGSALVSALQSSGHEVLPLVRSSSSGTQSRTGLVTWDPTSGQLSAANLEGIDAAVHLAGENIAARRWEYSSSGTRFATQGHVVSGRFASIRLALLALRCVCSKSTALSRFLVTTTIPTQTCSWNSISPQRTLMRGLIRESTERACST